MAARSVEQTGLEQGELRTAQQSKIFMITFVQVCT